MKSFKKLEPPDLEATLKQVEENPDDYLKLITEFGLNTLAIDEVNRERELHRDDPPEARRKYQIKAWRTRTFRTVYGKITVRYPTLNGAPEKLQALQIAEELEASFKKAVTDAYVSGVSDRDEEYDTEESGDRVPRSTVSWYYCQEAEDNLLKFTVDPLERARVLDLQIDTKYVKMEIPALPSPRYATQALVRVMGLGADDLVWRTLGLVVMPSESAQFHKIVYDSLLVRGVELVEMVTSDFHKSFLPATCNTFEGCLLQGCRFHLHKGLSDRLGKKEGGKREDLTENMRAIFDETETAQEAREAFEKRRDALEGILPEDGMRSLEFRLGRSLTYKLFPKDLWKEIATSNRDERENEEDERRLASINAEPGARATVRVSASIAAREDERLAKAPVGGPGLAREALEIYDELVARLSGPLEAAFEGRRVAFRPKGKQAEMPEPVALWCQMVVLPVDEGGLCGTVGVACAFGVDRNREATFLAAAPVMEESAGAYGQLAETLLSMGVDPEKVGLVLLDRARPRFAEAMGKAFPEADVIPNPGTFAEGIIAVTQDGSLRKLVESFVNRVFDAKDYAQAEERLGEFKEFLQNFSMDVNIWFYDTFRGDDTILVYKLMDQGIWDGYSLGDLMPYNSWATNISKFTNSPRGVEETVKGLLKFLSRKKRKSPNNTLT